MRPTTNACFNCGKEGHYARNCPAKGKRINLINWDGTTIDGSEDEGPSKVARIKSDLNLMTTQEKEELANEMGLGDEQDFRTV